ncbi:DNA-binding protein (plasmid) [Paenibacillus thiaminolyticus]|uniref:DNA-binding protein n=1 Tax=Paenibacillus thiaminolyticus TaxID=49283 RepID=UPI00232E976D|nr:DNA-binding protein [Paenibacillus thiaminolyticus]WCF11387.1 DNA-binding protein [Paenibacillus thiaminolyticus]
MSKAIYDYSHDQIEYGFQNQNQVVIEKETDYIFNKILAAMSTLFPDKLTGITIENDGFNLSSDFLFSPKHKKNLFKWLDRLSSMKLPASDIDFGKLKIDFEIWFYELGGECIEFHYPKSYLLKPSEAKEALGVSNVTLNKYVKQGMECLDNGSQHKIPKHAVELLRDPVYGVLMQMIGQKKKRLNQSPSERLAEIYQEIAELQLKYKKKTYQEAFADYNGDEMDDPTDYYRWMDLTEEMEEILRLAGGIK